MDPHTTPQSRFRRLLPVWLLATAITVLGGLLIVAALRPPPAGPDLALPSLSTSGTASPRDTRGPASPGASGQPSEAQTPAPESGAVLLAVGDIGSCDGQADDAVADLASRLPGQIALLGDIVYDSGTPHEFADCFDPAWGALRDRLHPVPGNHDYETQGASGYFDYFGQAAGAPGEGWYAWELGDWQVLALNSTCEAVGGCGPDSPEVSWLTARLASSPSCTLAYFHHARYSSGFHGDQDFMDPIWDSLVDGGVDVTLSGHDHSYERLSADGVRSFVVGTGGRSLYEFEHGPSAFTEERQNSAYGLLELTLHDGSYDWRFLALGASGFTDAGTGECH